MHDNLPDISISSTDTKLERVDRVWMDAVERHSAILQLGLTQSEKLPGIHLLWTVTWTFIYYCRIIKFWGGSIFVECVGTSHPQIDILHELIN